MLQPVLMDKTGIVRWAGRRSQTKGVLNTHQMKCICINLGKQDAKQDARLDRMETAISHLTALMMAREQPLRALVTAARPHTPESACIVRSLQRDALEFRRCSQLSAMLAGPQRAC